MTFGTFFPLVSLGVLGTPLGPWTAGRSTFYTLGTGNCGFTGLESTSTQFPYRLTAAPNAAFYDNSLTCGQCYEVSCVGPWSGTSACCSNTPNVTIMVTDQCPSGGWCSGDMVHFDLSQEAFTKIADTTCGVISTRYRQVTCDIPTNVQIIQKDGVNQWWFAIFVMNLNGDGGVSLVELKDSGSSGWVSGARQTYNAWVFQSSPGFVVPFSLRVTDQSNQVVTFTNVIQSINPGQTMTTTQQFSSSSGTTVAPTTLRPTANPTHTPTTLKPTTLRPSTFRPTTANPTTNKPTSSPQLSTTSPTKPSSLVPTASPTTHKPTSSAPTNNKPTSSPITNKPTSNPTSTSPTTVKPTIPPTKSTHTPTTKSPIKQPTTKTPIAKPTTKHPTPKPTTKAPIPKPTTHTPTLKPSRGPTTPRPTTPKPTTKKPTAKPTTKTPTPKPTTRSPTHKPTTRSPI